MSSTNNPSHSSRPAIGVIGLGTIGWQELSLWNRAGYPTVGFDVNSARVESLREAVPDTCTLSDRVDAVAGCDVLVVVVPNLDSEGDLSLAAFDAVREDLRRLPAQARLIILASTIPVGYTRRFAAELGDDLAEVVHVPERFDPGRGTALGEIARVVGGLSETAVARACDLYASAGVPTHPVAQVEVAEASKLLENSFRLVNIAFINEFAELCRRVGIAAADVIDAAATKPFAFMAHYPGPGAGGTCIPTMPRFLLAEAASRGLATPILSAAVASNDHVGARLAEHVSQLLAGGGIARGRVLVVGITYKPNYPDVRSSSSVGLVRHLQRHHEVTVFDPVADAISIPDLPAVRRTLPEDTFDAVIVAVKHASVDLGAIRSLAPIYFDLVRGSVQMESASIRLA